MTLYITNVYVDPRARAGLGVAHGHGAGLLPGGTGGLGLVLWPTERSRTLYARHGFVEPQDMMEAVLDPGRDLH